MPRWDFVCHACHQTFELAFRTFQDAQDARCPECGGTVEKQPSAPNFTVTGYNARNGYAKRQ